MGPAPWRRRPLFLPLFKCIIRSAAFPLIAFRPLVVIRRVVRRGNTNTWLYVPSRVFDLHTSQVLLEKMVRGGVCKSVKSVHLALCCVVL